LITRLILLGNFFYNRKSCSLWISDSFGKTSSNL